ncbi:MAG: 6-hydroxymethylpterin diphosphokinase MptE-like protein [Lachnospiraceae bacterium]
MKKKSLIYQFKQVKAIRVLAYPAVNLLRGMRYTFYTFTKEAAKIRRLKNSHAHERCFIIGNGPSLKAEDLDLLKGEFCFAANRIFKIFGETSWRPDCYLCVDNNVLRDIQKEVAHLHVPQIFIHMEGKKFGIQNPYSSITYINNYYPYLVDRYKRTQVKFSKDVAHHFVAGETVVYTAIQLALYMGFDEIYLLGVDHCYSKKIDAEGRLSVDASVKDYFGNLPSNPYSVQYVETVNAAYRMAKKCCEEEHVVIQNLTRGGCLNIFQRNSLEQVLSDRKEVVQFEEKSCSNYAY